MNIRNTSRLTAWILPLALSVACGDDGGGDDGATTEDATTTAGATDDAPTTMTSPTSDTTDPPGTTSGPDDTTGGPDPDSSSGGAADTAMVRVFHLGVGAPGVDVFANGEGPVFDNLEFRNSTEYAEVPAGDYTFDVSVTGSPAADAVLSPMLTLDADTKYTAVAIGDLAMTDGAPGLAAIALVDDDVGIAATDVRITVIHAAPAVGQVDVWEISDPKAPVALLSDVDFGAFATLPDIPAGPLEIGIDVDDDANPDLIFSVDATILAGAQVNVYANNDAAGDVALVAQLADGGVLPIAPN
jgi:hypothetical protein